MEVTGSSPVAPTILLFHLRTDILRANLKEFFSLSAASDRDSECAMGWVDYFSRGNLLRRALFMRANHAETGPAPCHRAHASRWARAARWNLKTDFLLYNGEFPGVDGMIEIPERYSQGRTKAETRRAFYERPATRYATYQRSLCNKCHGMD